MSGEEERLHAVLEKIPYIRFLGMRIELAGDEMTAILPFAQHLVGNPMIPALHGGVVGAFLEMTALAQLSVSEPLLPSKMRRSRTRATVFASRAWRGST